MILIENLKNRTQPVSPGFAVLEMVFAGDRMGVAKIELSSRYPSEGWSALSSDMFVLILEGAVLHCRRYEYRLCEQGDIIEILGGTEYFWEVKTGKVIMLVFNSPPFDSSERKA